MDKSKTVVTLEGTGPGSVRVVMLVPTIFGTQTKTIVRWSVSKEEGEQIADAAIHTLRALGISCYIQL